MHNDRNVNNAGVRSKAGMPPLRPPNINDNGSLSRRGGMHPTSSHRDKVDA